jgi:hypothetical protein
MEYGRIIKQGWRMTWRHKALWVFGIAAAIFGGGYGGGLQYNVGSGDVQRWRQMLPRMPYMMPRGWLGGMYPHLANIGPVLAAIIGIAVIMGLVLAIVGILVRYTSLGALISMVDEVRQTDETSFKSGLSRGWKRFLRLFAIDLLVGLGVFAIVLLMVLMLGAATLLLMLPGIALVSSSRGPNALGIIWLVVGGIGFTFLLIMLGVALSAVTTVIRSWAQRACVLDEQGVFASLGRGIALLRERANESLVTWLLLGLIHMAVGLVALLVVLLLAGLAVAFGFLLSGATRSAPVGLILAVPFILLLALVGVFVSGVYEAFRSSVWTLAFRELAPAN